MEECLQGQGAPTRGDSKIPTLLSGHVISGGCLHSNLESDPGFENYWNTSYHIAISGEYNHDISELFYKTVCGNLLVDLMERRGLFKFIFSLELLDILAKEISCLIYNV